ncbi:Hypothetical protein SMAX5B_009250 [Scophthalmus maximus]|uniref:Uncharacterized protein n=1 Tax=Scophthalmus maximus TaxID=52904 RepID=A0A2U9C1P4_SCOMX|nr:Hypothetical protein SMAX5B_009250 [Scophthalmus maximus]KAF0041695.1 hypothetical protein F2P81_005227 [Scophthalmus maximus]
MRPALILIPQRRGIVTTAGAAVGGATVDAETVENDLETEDANLRVTAAVVAAANRSVGTMLGSRRSLA